MSQTLASENVVLSSPLSFAGSAQRIWRLTMLSNNPWVKWLLLVPLTLGLIFVGWCFVLCWYCTFGILLVPWRLIRRGQRKDKRNRLQHRELLEQIQRSGR